MRQWGMEHRSMSKGGEDHGVTSHRPATAWDTLQFEEGACALTSESWQTANKTRRQTNFTTRRHGIGEQVRLRTRFRNRSKSQAAGSGADSIEAAPQSGSSEENRQLLLLVWRAWAAPRMASSCQ